MNTEWDDILITGPDNLSSPKEDQQKIKSLLASLNEKDVKLSLVVDEMQEKEKELEDLKSSMKNSSTSKIETRNELQLLVEANEKLLQENDTLSRHNELLVAENIALKDKCTENEQQIVNYKRSVMEITNTNKEMQCAIGEKDRELLSVNTAKEQLEKKLKNIEEKHDNFADEVDDTSNQRDNLGLMLQEKSRCLEEMEKQCTECTKKVVGLEMEIANERRQKTTLGQELKNSKERVEKLEEVKNNLKFELMEKEKERRQLKIMESNAMNSNGSLEEELMTRGSEFQRLKVLYDETEAKHNNLLTDLQQTKDMLDEVEQAKYDLSADNEILQERVKSLEKELKKRENIVVKLQDESKSLERSQEELTEIKETLEEEITKVTKKKEEIQKELNHLINCSVQKTTLTETEILLSEQIRINKELSRGMLKNEEVLKEMENTLEDVKEEWSVQKTELEKNIQILKVALKTEKELSVSKRNEEKECQQTVLILTNKLEKLHVNFDRIKKEREEFEEALNYLRADHDSLNHFTTNVKSQNDVLREDYNKEKSKCEELEQQLFDVERKLAVHHKTEDKDKATKIDLQNHILEMSAKNDCLAKKLSDQQNRLLQTEATISQLTVESANRVELQNEIQTYKQKLMNMTSNFEVGSHKIEQFVTDVARKEKKIAELESRLSHAVENEARLKSLLRVSEDGSVSREAYILIKKQLDEKNIEVEALAANIRDYEENLAIMDSKNKKSELLKQDLRRTQEEVTEQFENLKNQYCIAKDELGRIQRRLKEMHVDADESEEEMKRMKKEITGKTKIINDLVQEVEQVRKFNSDIEQECNEMMAKLEKLIKRNQELEAERQGLIQKSNQDNKSISGLKYNLERLERKKMAAESELEQTRSSLNNEETKASEFYKQLSEALSKDDSQSEMIENFMRDNDDLSAELEKSQSLVKELEVTLEATQHELTTVQHQYSIEKRSTIGLINKLKTSESENEKYNTTSAKLRAVYEKLQHDLKLTRNEIHSNQTVIIELRDELEEAKTKTDQLIKENLRFKEINSKNEEEYADLQEKYQELKSVDDTQRLELEEACTKLGNLEKIKKSAVNDREVLKAEVDTVSGKLTALNNALDRSRNQREKLLSDLNRSKQKVSEVEESNEESKQAIVKRYKTLIVQT